jgi:hypothetical protein
MLKDAIRALVYTYDLTPARQSAARRRADWPQRRSFPFGIVRQERLHVSSNARMLLESRQTASNRARIAIVHDVYAI